jgi:hypothetical protein
VGSRLPSYAALEVHSSGDTLQLFHRCEKVLAAGHKMYSLLLNVDFNGTFKGR